MIELWRQRNRKVSISPHTHTVFRCSRGDDFKHRKFGTGIDSFVRTRSKHGKRLRPQHGTSSSSSRPIQIPNTWNSTKPTLSSVLDCNVICILHSRSLLRTVPEIYTSLGLCKQSSVQTNESKEPQSREAFHYSTPKSDWSDPHSALGTLFWYLPN